jgi:hypothetical protein
MASAVYTADSQLGVLFAGTTTGTPRASQLIALAAFGPPETKFARMSQAQLLVARSGGEGDVSTRISQAVLMAAYGSGVPDSTRADSWTFVLDGHRFWVLPLGPEGDWAYDTVTKQWSQFITQGFDGLNFAHGVMWGLRIFGSDLLYPFLYELNADQADDEGFRPVEHIVTGALSTRAPNMIGVANFRLTGSVGVLSDASTAVNLKFSDDNGLSWVGPFTINLAQGQTNQPLVWSALGSFTAPGRIFQVSDSGGMLSLYGADVALNNYDEDGNSNTGGGGGGG